MATPFLNELKKQASFFFKDKIKTVRLVLTDATPTQLMTDEATNGNSWPPDTRTFRVISRAAFDIDDYWRIVEILHKRLMNFDRENWRGSYKALILLEHLLTHGPLSVALEFQDDKDTIKNMGSFQHIDEKGFNWGFCVKKLSERVLKLLEDELFRKQERAKAHNLTRGIQGFGSFNQRSSSNSKESLEFFASKTYGRCNSHYNEHGDQNQKTKFLASNGFFFVDEDGIGKKRHIDLESRKPEKYSDSNWLSEEDEYSTEDHPFCTKNKHPLTDSLLSSVE
ncbi:epsin-3 isoform X1 [Ziziphus jujuba]|uniref:Epsin-3 isoform X1 n=1 Tax=Ziziphus jujuba TaxID=326968 RepID=A0A6P6FZW7_ZIZJJ|nr:epsin-3 isoform X1 [Ziziphus jujuba]